MSHHSYPSNPGLLLTILQRVSFPNLTSEDLINAGVVRRRLEFETAKITKSAMALPDAEISDLHQTSTRESRRFYAHVNMDVRFSPDLPCAFAFGGLIIIAHSTFIFEAKRGRFDGGLFTQVPGAVSQAIALLKAAR